MYKGIKRFLCIGLALMLLVSGCSGSGSDKQGKGVKGGYRESELKMPDGYQNTSNPLFLPDGRLIMVAARIIDMEQQATEEARANLAAAAEDKAAGEPETQEDAAESAESAKSETADSVKHQEYKMPEQKNDILVWKDMAGEPTVDPLKLPINSYFDMQNSLLLDLDGNPVLKINTYDQEKGTQKFILCWLPEAKAAGKDAAPVVPVKEQVLDLGDSYPQSIVVLPDGMTAVSNWDSIKIYGKDGKKMKDLSASFINQMTRAGSKLVAVDGKEGELVYYDMPALKELSRVKLNRAVLNNAGNMVGLEDGTLYFYGQNGAYRIEPPSAEASGPSSNDGAEAVLVLDPLQYSLADPSIYVNSFTVGSDKRMVLTGNTDEMYSRSRMIRYSGGGGVAVSEASAEPYRPQKRVFLYTWDPELDLSNKTVLTVSTLFTDQILRVAAFEFQKKHPDVQIKIIQYYDKMENQMKWSDFIRTVNTDILSGKSADIMFLDNLPLKSYMRRGILVDLNPHIKELGGAEKLNMGIVNGMKNADGKLYALPLSFTTYALIGRKNVIEQVKDLQSLLTLKLESGQVALTSQQKEQLFQQLLHANLPAFVDKKTGNYRFDSPEFIEFLELFDRIYREAQTPPPELPENPTESDYQKYDWNKFYTDNQVNRYKGKIAMSMTMLGNLDSLAHEFTLSGGKDASWTFMPMLKDIGGEIFIPQTTLGVSAKSKHKELALEFIKLIFSGELPNMQNYRWGFSTIKSEQEKTIQDILEQNKQQEENGWKPQVHIDEKTSVEMMALTEQQMRDIVSRLEECTIPIQFDQTLSEFLNEEIKPFLYGRKSAREAAEALQRRAAAYLAE